MSILEFPTKKTFERPAIPAEARRELLHSFLMGEVVAYSQTLTDNETAAKLVFEYVFEKWVDCKLALETRGNT